MMFSNSGVLSPFFFLGCTNIIHLLTLTLWTHNGKMLPQRGRWMLTINRTKTEMQKQCSQLGCGAHEDSTHLCMCSCRGQMLEEEAQECLQLLLWSVCSESSHVGSWSTPAAPSFPMWYTNHGKSSPMSGFLPRHSFKSTIPPSKALRMAWAAHEYHLNVVSFEKM